MCPDLMAYAMGYRSSAAARLDPHSTAALWNERT